jgi:hypothetical protein
MVIFPVRVELANLCRFNAFIEADPRQHRRPATLDRQHQLTDRGLPLERRGLLFSKAPAA